MAEHKNSNSHAVMSSTLAKALIEAGVKHFGVGGMLADDSGGPHAPAQSQNSQFTPYGGVGNQNTGGKVDILGAGQQGDVNMFTGGIGGENSFINQTLPSTYLFNGLSGIGSALMNQYQASAPGIATQDFGTQIGVGQAQQQATYNNQYNLAQQLLAQSQGYGPNPAQAELANNTRQNAAMQASMMASQRGASANPALIARQAAMQGANLQQQSAGQAAALRAQQQLSAQGALSQNYQNMANEGLQQQQISQGALAAQNTAITQGQLGAENINANVAGQNAGAKQGIFGGAMNSIGAVAGMFGMNKGGYVPKKMADGGIAKFDAPSVGLPPLDPWQEQMKNEKAIQDQFTLKTPMSGMGGMGGSGGGGGGYAMPGGGGGQSLMPSAFAQGGSIGQMLAGGNVPGKAKVKGDSDKNDVVPTLLSPGETVIPRSIMNSPDMERKALEFLKHIKSQKKGYGGVIQAKACGGKV